MKKMLLLLALLTATFCFNVPAQEVVYLPSLLQSFSDHGKMHFTIEYVVRQDAIGEEAAQSFISQNKKSGKFFGQLIPELIFKIDLHSVKDFKALSSKEILEIIRKQVSNFSYQVDNSNPLIFHLYISNGERNNSALGYVFKEIEFEGKYTELISLLKKNKIDISFNNGFIEGVGNSKSLASKSNLSVKIKRSNVDVRSILSDFPSLENVPAILWIASVSEEGNVFLK